MSFASGSITRTTHEFDLTRAVFHRPDATAAPAMMIRSEFEAEVYGKGANCIADTSFDAMRMSVGRA